MTKLGDRGPMEQAISAHGLLPEQWVEHAAAALPPFELAWAVLLALGWQRHLARIILLGLLVVFTLANALALARGVSVDCGCFGGTGGSATTTLIRNLLLLATVATLWGIGRHPRLGPLPCTLRASQPRSATERRGTVLLVAAVLLGVAGEPIAAEDASSPEEVATAAPAQRLEPEGRYERRYEPMRDWRGEVMSYWVNLPKNWQRDRTYPIILEWPGRGGGPRTRLFPDRYQVDGHVHVGLTYPRGSRGGAMLYPTEAYVALVRHVYDDVVQHFQGDPEHVFIGGFSAGGFMTTGPGIALMIRAGLRDQLAGVLAGGCNWMSDPRYARNLNVLLWYGEKDSNSTDLPRRLPDLEEHAANLTVIAKADAGHTVDNAVEGPAIRRFLRVHGPDGPTFRRLYEAVDAHEAGQVERALRIYHRIAGGDSPAATYAEELIDRFEAASDSAEAAR